MSNETWTIDRWLYSVLAGDSTLLALITGVYADLAPLGTAMPYLVYGLYDGDDVMTAAGVRIMTAALYQVRVVTDSESYGAIEPAVAQADALLHRASGTVTGGTVISCVREAPLRYTELHQGKMYRHLGGLYRIQAQ